MQLVIATQTCGQKTNLDVTAETIVPDAWDEISIDIEEECSTPDAFYIGEQSHSMVTQTDDVDNQGAEQPFFPADAEKVKDSCMQTIFSVAAECELLPISDPIDLLNVVSYNAVINLMSQITSCSEHVQAILADHPVNIEIGRTSFEPPRDNPPIINLPINESNFDKFLATISVLPMGPLDACLIASQLHIQSQLLALGDSMTCVVDATHDDSVWFEHDYGIPAYSNNTLIDIKMQHAFQLLCQLDHLSEPGFIDERFLLDDAPQQHPAA